LNKILKYRNKPKLSGNNVDDDGEY